ncbi:restriction endonuclease subunit S [Listeria monocytogenes]|nr:restriction endonuclease subunit S [Listeria monocytogenes]EAE6914437.1 restriction endonuclease subunit S [Listeria monocytogenes]EAW7064263.1 restriction endonuclease subunit S [Listeria monocytogenes]EBH4207479.1 restriction endonuclease subunit S [Listeria monocytogenes]ECC0337182.1 restriction endonuclease subunit S [Listeria monocytogenes]
MSHIKKYAPRRRFEKFSNADDWEQRKFEDCFKFPVSTNSLSRVMLNYDKGEVKNVHYGDVLIKYPCILNIKKEEIPYITGGCLKAYNSNLLENGDLIFADAAEDETVGKAVEVNGITNENLVSGLHTIVARATTQKAKYFLGYYINSDIYHRQLLRLMQGSKVSAISKGNLQKTDVSFPKDIEEQQKIGSYFKKLDDTIALHQRKLEKIKALKTAYLSEMFPAEGETKPKRRFARFTDDWEQRKLGDVTNYIKGFAFKSRDYADKGIRIIRVSDLSSDKIKELNDNVYVTQLVANENKKFIIEKEDIIITTVGSKAEMKESAVGRPIIVRHNNNYLLNQNLVKVRSSESSFSYFIYCQLINPRYSDYIATIERGNANQANIAISDLWEYSFLSPKKDEQTKIGTFFKQLDHTIALHQRKLQKLQNIKKAYLNEMFI